MINKKVRNATPTAYKGVVYRSKMEVTFAMMLDSEGIEYGYESETWMLMQPQKYMGKTIRAVTYTPDFIVDNVIIEIKGWRNDVFPLKKKLIIKFINDNCPDTLFIEARNINDMRQAIYEIKKRRLCKATQSKFSSSTETT